MQKTQVTRLSSELHIALALVSGIVIEALYALNVLFITERRSLAAGLLAVIWGVAFLVGVNESFKTLAAAAAWCLGLGLGTILGIWLKGKGKSS